MIKFFRHIRRRSLANDRFTRYLLYALGEIVLVVIGILIALNVNNWNEQRKIARSNRVHLQKMVTEMAENIARMELLTSDSKGTMAYGFPPLDEAILNCDSLLRLSYDGLTEDHLPFILSARFFAGRSSLNLQDDVFEELKSTGHLNSVGRDTLVAAIKDYNKRHLREEYYNRMHNDHIIRAIEMIEGGLGKLLLDHAHAPERFSIADYPWYFQPTSREYQDLQTAFAIALDSQQKNHDKMIEIARSSQALKQLLLNELSDTPE